MLIKCILTQFSRALTLNSTRTLNPLTNQISAVTNSIKNLTLNTSVKCFSVSAYRNDLMEFFDDKKNWTEEKVKHGRPWRLDELRLKSNSDLHKLWFVLHKERNMLLTMEEAYREKGVSMPSHERIAKVDESMESLLSVVQEREIAFNLLETGETKKPLNYRRYNSFGYIQYYRPREYLVPWYMNKSWKLKYHYKKIPYWSKYYTSINRLRLRKERAKIVKRVNYHTHKVLSEHPEFENDKQFVREYFEKKFNYKPPLSYNELIKRPAPNELPKELSEKMKKSKKDSYFGDDEL